MKACILIKIIEKAESCARINWRLRSFLGLEEGGFRSSDSDCMLLTFKNTGGKEMGGRIVSHLTCISRSLSSYKSLHVTNDPVKAGCNVTILVLHHIDTFQMNV